MHSEGETLTKPSSRVFEWNRPDGSMATGTVGGEGGLSLEEAQEAAKWWEGAERSPGDGREIAGRSAEMSPRANPEPSQRHLGRYRLHLDRCGLGLLATIQEQLQPRCRRDVLEIPPRCSRDAAEMQSRSARALACTSADLGCISADLG